MAITLGDLAALSGLTRASVSQILNGRGAYSPTTCARVRALAAAHNYRPNASARAVRAGRIGTVGLVIPENAYEGYIFHGMLIAMEHELAKHDCRLAICAAGGSNDDINQSLVHGLVDGVLINHHFNLPRELDEVIATRRLPAVWINAMRDHSAVMPDDRGGVHDAVAHLIAIGHRSIAYFDAHNDPYGSTHFSSRDRAEGYAEAMAAGGLAPRILARLGGLEFPLGIPYLHAAWKETVPTAIVCYAEQDAHIAMISLVAFGKQPMRDVCIILVSDTIPITAFGRLPTWLIDGTGLATHAVEMLLAGGEALPANRLIPLMPDRERCIPPPP